MSHRTPGLILAFGLLLGACAPVAPGVVGASPSPSVAPSAGTPSVAPSPMASSTPTPSTNSLVLSGAVLDEQLAPLVDAEVVASGVAGATSRTDAQGRYRLNLAPGRHEVVASKAGMTTRSRVVDLNQATDGFNFGGIEADGLTSPYFLCTAPEVTKVHFAEARPGGPLTVELAFSEAIASGAAQQAAMDRVELYAAANTPFLRTAGGGVAQLKMQAAFEPSGQLMRLTYPHAYLASGPLSGEVRYSVTFPQIQTDKKDPVTREPVFEDLGIVDTQGQALGRGRAAYAFLQDRLSFLNGTVMVDKTYGYGPADRRWNLTHTSQVSFVAQKDLAPPQLLSVSVDLEEQLGTAGRDLMKLTFNKPMRVAKDRENPFYTRLDVTKDLVVLNVAKENTGSFVPLGAAKPLEVEFLDAEPNVVYLRFPFAIFKDYKRVEVLLGRDVLDPAGNAPDPLKSQAVGAIS